VVAYDEVRRSAEHERKRDPWLGGGFFLLGSWT